MPFMTWDENLSVEVHSIDEQHKVLINMINELFDGMKQGKGKDMLGPVLDGLVDYTSTHFKYEEGIFDKTQYSDTFRHKKEHEALVKRVMDIQAKYKSGVTALSIEVMDFLKSWLLNHIMGTDKKYSAHMQANGIT